MFVEPVSQDKLSPGKTAAATEFRRANFAELPYFLGNFVAPPDKMSMSRHDTVPLYAS